MRFIAPAKEDVEKSVKKQINYDELQLLSKKKQIREWMKKQPHLPQIPDDIADIMIKGFLQGSKMSAEKAKFKIDTYYAMRHQLPQIFDDRDPTISEVRDSVDKIRLFPLKELTPEGIRVSIISFNSDPDKRFSTKDLIAFYKRVMALGDARIQMGDLCSGEYLVMDGRGFYLSHLTELPWLLIQKFTELVQVGLSVRLRGIFTINSPAYVDTAVNLLKPALKEKVRNRFYVFRGDHTNLYKYIPQHTLPSDFGGDEPSIEQSNREWHKVVESMRDFFVEDTKRITDESKRPAESPNMCGQMFGVNGSFNKLNLD